VSAGNGALTWWANRKSQLGIRPSVAKAPPKLPDGREWWCAPPTALPEPAHIDYVTAFYRELIEPRQMSNSKARQRTALVQHVKAWLETARRLCHERLVVEQGEPVDLMTTDNLLLECKAVIGYLVSRLERDHGQAVAGERRVDRVLQELRAKEAQILRRRTLDPAHRVRRIPAVGEKS
jgi:hypothetical protein